MTRLRNLLAVILLALTPVAAVAASQTPVSAISSCSSETDHPGSDLQYHGGRAVCTSAAGPAVGYAVLVRCNNTGTTWHVGIRRNSPGSYQTTYSQYLCPSNGIATQTSVQLYF